MLHALFTLTKYADRWIKTHLELQQASLASRIDSIILIEML